MAAGGGAAEAGELGQWPRIDPRSASLAPQKAMTLWHMKGILNAEID